MARGPSAAARQARGPSSAARQARGPSAAAMIKDCKMKYIRSFVWPIQKLSTGWGIFFLLEVPNKWDSNTHA